MAEHITKQEVKTAHDIAVKMIDLLNGQSPIVIETALIYTTAEWLTANTDNDARAAWLRHFSTRLRKMVNLFVLENEVRHAVN